MTDYLFESARVRTMENDLVGRERMERLLKAADEGELVNLLREFGVDPVTEPESGRLLREETLLARLRKAYVQLVSAGAEAAVLRLWLYPYDCNNIKAAIKGFLRKIDPRSMMFDFGTVNAETIIRMAECGSFVGLPPAMQAAANEAVAWYAKHRDPQKIDLLLDRACFADMLASARASGVEFAVRLVCEKIDLCNLMMTVRVLRMKSGEIGRLLLNDALIDGGRVPPDEWKRLYAAGEEALWERLQYGDYAKLAETVLKGNGTLAAVELATDNFYMETLCKIKMIPYGAEVPIGYLLATEYEVRNLRILLVGKEVGLAAETIGERIREHYV